MMLAKTLPFRSTSISDSKMTQKCTAGIREREVALGLSVLT